MHAYTQIWDAPFLLYVQVAAQQGVPVLHGMYYILIPYHTHVPHGEVHGHQQNRKAFELKQSFQLQCIQLFILDVSHGARMFDKPPTVETMVFATRTPCQIHCTPVLPGVSCTVR